MWRVSRVPSWPSSNMAMIAASAIAAGIWLQQVRRRPTLSRFGYAMTESDWLAHRQLSLQTSKFMLCTVCYSFRFIAPSKR